jgi:hypothetical protein
MTMSEVDDAERGISRIGKAIDGHAVELVE